MTCIWLINALVSNQRRHVLKAISGRNFLISNQRRHLQKRRTAGSLRVPLCLQKINVFKLMCGFGLQSSAASASASASASPELDRSAAGSRPYSIYIYYRSTIKHTAFIEWLDWENKGQYFVNMTHRLVSY